MQYDIKKKSAIFENINIHKDINKYINNNKTNITQLYKYQYAPYISEFENVIPKDSNNTNNTYSENIINNVKLFISNIFTKERPNEINPNSDYNQNIIILNEIKDIINKIFKNEIISKEDKDNIIKLILLKKKRRKLLKEINNYCLNNINSSLLNESSFDNLSFLLKEALKVLQIEKDYDSIKLILNFATSFYQISGEKEKKKIFIQNSLLNEKIFEKYDFWKDFIKSSIIEEMYNQKSYNLFSNKKEDEEKNKIRIKDIVISKINIIINYMIDFHTKYSYMKQILDELKNYYELSDDDIEKFMSKINEYNKNNNNEEKKENNIEENNNNIEENNEKKEEEKEEEKEKENENDKEKDKIKYDIKEEEIINDDDDLGNLNINSFNENLKNEEDKK